MKKAFCELRVPVCGACGSRKCFFKHALEETEKEWKRMNMETKTEAMYECMGISREIYQYRTEDRGETEGTVCGD